MIIVKTAEPVLIPIVTFRLRRLLAAGTTEVFQGIGTMLGSELSLKVA